MQLYRQTATSWPVSLPPSLDRLNRCELQPTTRAATHWLDDESALAGVFGSGCYGSEVGFQLRHVEARGESRVRRLRWQDRVGLVPALVPPRPGGLLGIPPGQHGEPV